MRMYIDSANATDRQANGNHVQMYILQVDLVINFRRKIGINEVRNDVS